MANILDYLDWRGDITFAERPFNEVDNLLLAELSYLDFGGIVPGPGGGRAVPLWKAAEAYFAKTEGRPIDMGVLVPNQIPELLRRAAASPRFRDMKLNGFVDHLDTVKAEQFAALAAECGDGTVYLSFRGTDDTLAGWKEDFYLSCMREVPAQKMAVTYTEAMAHQYPRIKLRLGGHSKGGNLAVYAAVFCGEAIQKQIRAVYNNDGPGFYASLLELPEHRRIAGKITTLLPESSVVGMLLEHEEAYQVVRSTQIGLMQHDGFSWQVLGERFEHLTELAEGGRIMDQTLRSFLRELTEPQRAQFVDTLFDILTCTDASTLTDLKVGGLKTASAMVKALQKLDKPTRKALSDTLKLLVRSGARSVLEELGVNRLRENRLIEALSGYLESHSRT